jgi:hypothetical protein
VTVGLASSWPSPQSGELNAYLKGIRLVRCQTFEKRLRPLVELLSRVTPGRKITGADFPTEIICYCVGRATVLKDGPLYAPYAAECLRGDEPVRPVS